MSCRLKKADMNCKWHIVIWLVTIILLGISCGICYILIELYSGCLENKMIAVGNIVACAILLMLTVIPGIGKGIVTLRDITCCLRHNMR